MHYGVFRKLADGVMDWGELDKIGSGANNRRDLHK
jgi:hypothetical protein